MGKATALLLLAMLLGACTSEPEAAAPPEKETLSGTLDARGDCIAAGNGYQIVVTDESKKIVATTTTDGCPTNPNSPENVCEAVPFSVQVPNRDFYTLEIGQHEGPTWARADLAESAWKVELLLNVDECDSIFQDCDYLGTSPFYEA